MVELMLGSTRAGFFRDVIGDRVAQLFAARLNGRSARIGVANRRRGGALPAVSAVDRQLTAAQGGGVLSCGAQTVTIQW